MILSAISVIFRTLLNRLSSFAITWSIQAMTIHTMLCIDSFQRLAENILARQAGARRQLHRRTQPVVLTPCLAWMLVMGMLWELTLRRIPMIWQGTSCQFSTLLVTLELQVGQESILIVNQAFWKEEKCPIGYVKPLLGQSLNHMGMVAVQG